MIYHFSGLAAFGFSHVDITFRAGEEIDELAGGASGMDVDRVGEAGERTCEGQAARMYGTGFTAGSLGRVVVRDMTRRPGIEVGSDEEYSPISIKSLPFILNLPVNSPYPLDTALVLASDNKSLSL